MAITITNLETVLSDKIAAATTASTDKDLLLISKSVEALDNSTGLRTADIGTTVQAYDADLVTLAGNDGSNLTGVLKPGDIGTTVQAYDSTIVVDADIGTTVQGYDDQLNDVAGLSVTDGNFIVGDGTNFVVENSATARTSLGLTIGTDVGYLNIPKSGSSKTAAYTLALTDIGELIEVGSSGSITIPDATFSTGDVILIFNNTSGVITLTCSITTAYIGGTDTDKATIDVATRGICNVLFISPSVCVITGNVA
jgi:hypothetical protein